MTDNFLVIASMGGSGQKWLEEMLRQVPSVNMANWIPAMPAEYKKTIEHNPMLRKIDLQNHSLRTLMPLDCLLEETLRLYSPAPLTVIAHFHNATSLWQNYQKYPNPMKHKVAYLYGCPIKRLRSTIKNQLHYATQDVVDAEALRREVAALPQLGALIADTEQKFAMTLTDIQRISIARLIYVNLSMCEDLQRADLLDARMLNFETLKREPAAMRALLAWATDDAFVPQEQSLTALYAQSDDLAKYHYEGYQFADDNQEALIAAPYDGEAIWSAMNDWQRYMFLQMTKLLPFDYIDFYNELGIDLSYLKAS
jgi:predicted alpha/beta hydrolase family esterase